MVTHLIKSKTKTEITKVVVFKAHCGVHTLTGIPEGDTLTYSTGRVTCKDCEEAIGMRELAKLA